MAVPNPLTTKVSISKAKKSARDTPQTPSACRVALIGFGTVGRAVAKILCESKDPALRLTHICNRNVERKKQSWVPPDVIWTEDVESVLHSDANIIIELDDQIESVPDKNVYSSNASSRSQLKTGVLLALRLVATLVMLAARKLPRPRSTVLRLAIANIHRPGALTPTEISTA